MTVELLVALALVLANGFFVASEFALARLRATQVAEVRHERRRGSSALAHAVGHLDAYLAACQLGITVASIGLGAIGESAFEHLIAPVLGHDAEIAVGAAIAFGLITLLHVVVGELAPKSAAIARSTEIGLRVAPAMRVFYYATKPLVDLFNGLGNLVLAPFGIAPASESGHAPHSERELLELLAQSRQHGLIEPEEQEIAERGFAFADRTARDLMQPRGAIEFVVLDAGRAEAARRTARCTHTRLPVCTRELGLDDPVGFVHGKDLLAAIVEDRQLELEQLVRPLGRVPEEMPVTNLLTQMRAQRRHMMLVYGAGGSTVGLVTLEDLLEELVGEIEDEFDARAPIIAGSSASLR